MTEKTLLLLRHAKSGWDDPSLADFDRPLAMRGREAAPRIGEEMARRGWLPDLAIVSPAMRTRQTWALVAASLPRQPDVTYERAIYEAQLSNILDAVRAVPERVSTLLVVGHNPGLEELAAALAAPESDPDALARMRAKFPTAALARLTFEGLWLSLDRHGAILREFIAPADLA